MSDDWYDEQAAQPHYPDRLPEHLERDGIEAAAQYARQILRVGAADIPAMSDAELLGRGASAEEEAREWPPDVLAVLLSIVYQAEIVERARRSRETDRKRLFIRKARKAGYRLPD